MPLILKAYNDEIVRISNERNVGLVEYQGQQFRLGIADFDGEYTEFITHGSKRYCYREKGDLHITVAGVPKDGVYCLDDDITNFRKGFIFRNSKTFRDNFKKVNPDKHPKWKMKTQYLIEPEIKRIELDGSEIEYGCAIRLSDTEYELDHTIPYDEETGLPLKFEMDIPIFD